MVTAIRIIAAPLIGAVAFCAWAILRVGIVEAVIHLDVTCIAALAAIFIFIGWKIACAIIHPAK